MQIANLRSLCLLTGLLCNAASASVSPPQDYQYVLNTSGIAAILPSLTAEMLDSAIRNADRCESQADVGWVLPANTLLDNINDKLTAATTDSQLQTVTSWYRSALAQKIAAHEQQMVDEEDLYDFINRHDNNPQWQTATLPLISQIYENTRAGELNTVIGLEIEYAGLMLSGCIDKSAKEISGSDHSKVEKMKADIIRNDKQMMMTLFRHETIYAISYSLRSLSTAELASYANFTRENSDFYKSLVQSFEAALQQSTDRILPGKAISVDKLSESNQD